jgi:hypothetical protein
VSATRANGLQRGRAKWVVAAIAGVLALLALLLLRRPEQPAEPRYAAMTFLPNAETLRDGDFSVYSSDKPLSGRPEKQLPICREIYDHVELDLDGKRAGNAPIILKAGTTIDARGTIFANRTLDPRVVIDGGLALVSRADNKPGWTTRSSQYSKSHFSQGRCTFEVRYVVRDEPGEYLLVVVSSARVGISNHPVLLAAQYPVVIE